MFICWIFGVAYLTSDQGPGAPLGNLYYFTWGSFLSAFMLLASCFEDYQAAKGLGSTEGDSGDGNIAPQIEEIDDQI